MKRRQRRRRLWLLGIALVVVAGLVLGGRAVWGSPSLPGEVQAFTPLAYAPHDVAVDPAHNFIVASYGNSYLPHTNRVVVIAAQSGKVLHSFDVGAYAMQWLAVDFRTQHALAFSGDGGPAIRRTPHLIDLRTGHIRPATAVPLDPMAVALDAENGDAVVSGSLAQGGSPALALVDISSGRLVRLVRLQGQAGAGAGPIAFDPVTHRILVSTTGGLNLLDARSGALLAYAPLRGGNPDRIAVDEQTHRAYVALLNAPPPGCRKPCDQSIGAFALVDDRDGRLVQPRVLVPGTSNVGALAVASRVHKLFVTDYGPLNTPLDYVYVLDARTGHLLQRVHIGRVPHTLAVDAVRGRVVVGGDRGVDVIDSTRDVVVRSIALPDDVQLLNLDARTGSVVTGNTAPVIGPMNTGPATNLFVRLVRAIRDRAVQVSTAHRMGGSVSVLNLQGIH